MQLSDKLTKRISGARRWQGAQRGHRKIKLAQAERPLICESGKPAPRKGIDAARLEFGGEHDEFERLVQSHHAKLARRRLGHEQVLALDCAPEDSPRVSLRCHGPPRLGPDG
jgi:hypothetical protein